MVHMQVRPAALGRLYGTSNQAHLCFGGGIVLGEFLSKVSLPQATFANYEKGLGCSGSPWNY